MVTSEKRRDCFVVTHPPPAKCIPIRFEHEHRFQLPISNCCDNPVHLLVIGIGVFFLIGLPLLPAHWPRPKPRTKVRGLRSDWLSARRSGPETCAESGRERSHCRHTADCMDLRKPTADAPALSPSSEDDTVGSSTENLGCPRTPKGAKKVGGPLRLRNLGKLARRKALCDKELSEEELQTLRLQINSRERKRMHDLNSAMDGLR